MKRPTAKPELVLDAIADHGGLAPGVAAIVAKQTNVSEAEVYGAGSFYTLLAPGEVHRVCDGPSCRVAGADDLLAKMQGGGAKCIVASCLGQCDRAPVALGIDGELAVMGDVGHITPANDDLVMNLAGTPRSDHASVARARTLSPEEVIAEAENAGLQGRGGAGFPAHIKWKGVRAHLERRPVLVVNADEGEPGTFKDRMLMEMRPDLLVDGCLIAAHAIGANQIYVYIRGEFAEAQRAVKRAFDDPIIGDIEVIFVEGHGAYICGEETALLNAIEGKRGEPRIKPPFPTEVGLWGRPTLVQNVETLACLPDILLRGGERFRRLGKTEPGTKLYCVSGHVKQPGTYELPLGSSLNEVVAAAGGVVGTLMAFTPGGASSGFLPPSMADMPLDFRGLGKVGTFLGSAGVVVYNDTVDLVREAAHLLHFFERESCGQCAPCRIGCQVQRRSTEKFAETGDKATLSMIEDIAWEMNQGSICGLGHAASNPITSLMRHFPERVGA